MFGTERLPVSLWQDILFLPSQEERGYTCPQLGSFCCGNLPVPASGMLVIPSCNALLKLHLEHLGIPQQALHKAFCGLLWWRILRLPHVVMA